MFFRFNVSKARALKLIAWRSKHGPFKNVEDILELDGFGEIVLEKFCTSIVKYRNVEEDKIEQSKEISSRKYSQYCQPSLDETFRIQLKSCLGINITMDRISWAKITKKDSNGPMTFNEWDDYEFGDKRLHLSDLAINVKKICDKLPVADAYVLETPIAAQPALPGKNVIQLNINVQRSQIIGMLGLGLLYKRQETLNPEDLSQHVFFLKNFLPARLFRTKIGSERVSTENTVLELLRYQYNLEDRNSKIEQKNSFVSQVNASLDVREVFEQSDEFRRDHLGQAFLIAMTFMKLCVLKSPESINQLESRKR